MPSRRKLIEMTPQEIEEYLRRQQMLIIVSNGRDGYPHPMPMHYYVDEKSNLWVITFRKSQKVKNFERDARAGLLVESGEQYNELKAVMIYANAHIIDDYDVVIDTMIKAAAKRQVPDTGEPGALSDAVRSTAAKRVALKFVPNKYISWDHTKLGSTY